VEKDNLEILLEDIRGKFELVLEGHTALDKKIDSRFDQLNQKIDLVDFKVGVLNQKIDDVDARLSKKIDDVDARLGQKIDAVAADLKAHREDTEAHPKFYRVGEQ
jgi:hypothetical protein